jgi:hypothetical protein
VLVVSLPWQIWRPHQRWSVSAYADLVNYLQTLVQPRDPFPKCADVYVDVEADIADLDDFYGNRLDGYFERNRY